MSQKPYKNIRKIGTYKIAKEKAYFQNWKYFIASTDLLRL